jgi:hypothetical protein
VHLRIRDVLEDKLPAKSSAGQVIEQRGEEDVVELNLV